MAGQSGFGGKPAFIRAAEGVPEEWSRFFCSTRTASLNDSRRYRRLGTRPESTLNPGRTPDSLLRYQRKMAENVANQEPSAIGGRDHANEHCQLHANPVRVPRWGAK